MLPIDICSQAAEFLHTARALSILSQLSNRASKFISPPLPHELAIGRGTEDRSSSRSRCGTRRFLTFRDFISCLFSCVAADDRKAWPKVDAPVLFQQVLCSRTSLKQM